MQNSGNSQHCFEKEGSSWRICTTYDRTYYRHWNGYDTKAIVIEPTWHWIKDRLVHQSKKVAHLEREPYIYIKLNFHKDRATWLLRKLFNSDAGTTEKPHIKLNLGPYFMSYIKMNWKLIIDLKVRPKIRKLLEEKLLVTLACLNRFLGEHTNSINPEKMNKLDFINMKTFWSSIITVKKWEEEPQSGKKYLQNISDWGVKSRTHKGFSQLTDKTRKNLTKRWCHIHIKWARETI